MWKPEIGGWCGGAPAPPTPSPCVTPLEFHPPAKTHFLRCSSNSLFDNECQFWGWIAKYWRTENVRSPPGRRDTRPMNGIKKDLLSWSQFWCWSNVSAGQYWTFWKIELDHTAAFDSKSIQAARPERQPSFGENNRLWNTRAFVFEQTQLWSSLSFQQI